jgi:cyclopropane fatty-acyl-phospholipid synthase-like methyltransferase
MGFYDDEKTALQYIELAEGYDGQELIEILRMHLPPKASVLEIGMGPGVDLKILKKYFQVTGSDNSSFFLDRFRESNPDADLLCLDAVGLETERSFDCIYSNKVLHHLTNEELIKSLHRQKAIFSDTGLVMHSFWRGRGIEEYHGLKFVYQTEDSLRSMFDDMFNILNIDVYSEMEADDSIFVLASV